MIKRHLENNWNNQKYLRDASTPGRAYRNVRGWVDYPVGQRLLYSHRTTDFTHDLFDEAYHMHDDYELVLYIRGSVDYICNRNILAPQPGSLVWFAPGAFHNARLLTESCYERYVFRFGRDVFHFEGDVFPLPAFMSEQPDANFFHLTPACYEQTLSLLGALDAEMERPSPNLLFAYTTFIQLLSIWNRDCHRPHAPVQALPEVVLQTQHYIEENYAAIGSVSEISSHLFYSREHISRIFKQYFNMSVAEYLTRFRIAKSIELLQGGCAVTDACFAVGFGSMSAFSAAFKKIKGCLPSKYR